MHLLLFVFLLQAPVPDQYLEAQKAFAANPKSEDRLIALANILFQRGQTERAIGLLESFATANPKASHAKVLLALGYVHEEKYDKARSLAGQAATDLPNDYYAHHVLALSLFGLNRFDEAETRFKRAIELKPDFAESHFRLGLLHARKPGALEPARASFQRALELGYSQAETYKNLGSINIKLGRYSDAIEQLNMSLKLNPDYAEAYFVLADALRKSGATEQAADAMKRFQALNAIVLDRRARANRSQAAYEEGMGLLFAKDGAFISANFAKAYVAFRRAVEELPQLDAAYYRMAQMDYLRNDNAHAVQNIRRALDLNPFEPEYYFVLSSCLKETDPRGALDAATKAVSLNPGVADFQNLLGILFEKAGDDVHAVESYRRAAELDPKNEAFQMNLSMALKKLSKKK